METQNSSNKNLEPIKDENRFNRGRALGGLIVVIVGVVLLARQVGVDFPYWFFSWPMLLIAIGIYVGFRHSFRNPGWIIPVAIGTLFLLEDIIPELEIKPFIWPIIIISIGLVMIFRPRGRNRGAEYWKQRYNHGPTSESLADNAFETVTIFGGDKKQIISKDFKGGESVCFFGGVEINLTQADINGRAEIEVVQCFGGTKIIVPPHWKVQSDELVCVFGSLEDKRQVAGSVVDPTKILVLKGTCMFGGIDLRSF
ncbi:DUF5668 domain-containing protein [Chryseolinea sp. H1M3-3]|uniref:LiaF transmembrane domain-containing protein n=1 Tax=Chryseolinea sp. H1M3-3 TaxID=3034144 RepID=UPI0023EBA0CC|nr:DUF5668 domain-containing protein [Chryseolinea sp. H1M3-3]